MADYSSSVGSYGSFLGGYGSPVGGYNSSTGGCQSFLGGYGSFLELPNFAPFPFKHYSHYALTTNHYYDVSPQERGRAFRSNLFAPRRDKKYLHCNPSRLCEHPNDTPSAFSLLYETCSFVVVLCCFKKQ